MDRLESMRTFVAAVETGSLSGAARKLRRPLPTISRKVSELETHLGVQLLIRSTRKLTLTEAGADYVVAARRILDAVGEAERAVTGEFNAPRGELVVTAPVVLGRRQVLPVVVEFLTRFPDINVQLTLSNRNVHLVDDQIDVAVRVGALSDSSMKARRLGDVRMCVCGSPSYFAEHGTPKSPGDLSKMTCVTFDFLGSAEVWTFPPKLRRRGASVAIRSRISVNTAEAAVDAAAAGIGVTRVLSPQAADAVLRGDLEIVLRDFEPEPLPVSFLYPGQGVLPLKTRGFLDFAAPRLRHRFEQMASRLSGAGAAN